MDSFEKEALDRLGKIDTHIGVIDTHYVNMSENAMNLSSDMRAGFKELKDQLTILNGTVKEHKTKIAVHDNTLRWHWIIGGIVVSGIGIAISAMWMMVF